MGDRAVRWANKPLDEVTDAMGPEKGKTGAATFFPLSVQGGAGFPTRILSS
jgi:hypothetical protein